MKTFYTIENGLPVMGSGKEIPEGYVEYDSTQKPDDLVQAQQSQLVRHQKSTELATLKKNLEDLDIKRIRPLAEGDDEYLAELNGEAETLRNQVRTLIAELEA